MFKLKSHGVGYYEKWLKSTNTNYNLKVPQVCRCTSMELGRKKFKVY